VQVARQALCHAAARVLSEADVVAPPPIGEMGINLELRGLWRPNIGRATLGVSGTGARNAILRSYG
jgi:hypothetical protein